MHSDTHLLLHHLRAAELTTRAAATVPGEHRLRARVGWLLVEVGLRLAAHRTPHRRAHFA
ncbi:hypothetical protein ABR738_15965 [Streptomyces sp. Edi4]|uniref:hypothetical protein n=1 Tax=Streptomyces sp. Edi4 TaxID=3162527 RepID=UPI003305BC96